MALFRRPAVLRGPCRFGPGSGNPRQETRGNFGYASKDKTHDH